MADLPAGVAWTVVVVAAVGTFFIRVSFVEVLADREVPPRIEAALRFVPPAVLAALVLPKLLLVDGAITVAPENPRLLAGLVAAVAAFYTEDMFATVVVGMGALWALTFLL